MKALLYILLYTPIVLLSALGYMYYGWHFGIDITGIKDTWPDLTVFKEVYRMVNTGVVPICLITLIYLVAKCPERVDMPFRVQAISLVIFFITPKLFDHVLTVIKVSTGNPAMFDAYTESGAQYWMLILFLICTPMRINHLKRIKKYNGSTN